MIATLKTLKAARVGVRGCYRIIVNVGDDDLSRIYSRDHGMRNGFSQVIKLCRALRSAKADYTVNWDTPHTGVLILFTIERKHAKPRKSSAVTVTRKVIKCEIERPPIAKCETEIKKLYADVVQLYARRRHALLPDELTCITQEQAQEWNARRLMQRAIGHGLAKLIASDREEDYKALDMLFGRKVRRASQLSVNFKSYHAYLLSEARYGSEVWDCRAASDCMPDASHIAETIYELAYWREMLKLIQTE